MPVGLKKYILDKEAESLPFLDQESLANVAFLLIYALLHPSSPLGYT